MFRKLTFFAGSKEAGKIFSAPTAYWPTAMRCTTIRDARRDYWRKVDEAENASEASTATELRCWCGACLAPRSEKDARNR